MYKGYKIVAVCVSKIHDQTIFNLIKNLNDSLTKYNYRLLVFNTINDLFYTDIDTNGRSSVFNLIPFDIIDYVFIYENVIGEKECLKKLIDRCNAANKPVISLGTENFGDCFNVAISEKESFKNIVNHLIEVHGFNDIIMISGNSIYPFCAEREEAFKETLKEHGIQFRQDMILFGELWFLPTEYAVQKIIDSGNMPQAIVCINDFTAITTCTYLANHGIKVPQDVVVTGYDGIQEGYYFTPSLTTSKHDITNTANVIVNLINDIDAGRISPYNVEITNSLIKGASCGCGKNHRAGNAGQLIKEADERLAGVIDTELHLNSFTDHISSCNSYRDLATFLNTLQLFNVTVLLNNDIFDYNTNPTEFKRTIPFDDEMIVIFEDGFADIDEYRRLPKKKLLPKFDDYIDQTTPMIFSPLCNMGNTIGYMCSYYPMLLADYLHIPLYATTLESGFGAFKNVRYLKHIALSMKELSGRDPMTNMYNRNGFYEHIDSFLLLATPRDRVLVASVDMDGLKYVNDHYGHIEGDYAIKTIASALGKINAKHVISARFGGDEFIICAILNKGQTEQSFTTCIEKSLKMSQLEKKPYEISVSVGCSICEKSNFDFDALYKKSDAAMYMIKENKPHHRKPES